MFNLHMSAHAHTMALSLEQFQLFACTLLFLGFLGIEAKSAADQTASRDPATGADDEAHATLDANSVAAATTSGTVPTHANSRVSICTCSGKGGSIMMLRWER
eukprot:GHVT01031980.1.p2 GENE.GHVT01031980.1~~GHVT01031980.1.p2  ORF type:complete len:103 (+),score=12.98 GHVT01031980.1:1910-2218(+)